MITCPSCSSSRTLIHLDADRRGRCLRCGGGWVQEGAWHHSITRPAGHDRLRAVADIEVPTGMSGMDLARAVVGELQRAQGAEVTGHDVVGGVPGISLRMPVPLALRFEAQQELECDPWRVRPTTAGASPPVPSAPSSPRAWRT